MSLDPFGHRKKRQEMLRGVYEENLRISKKQVPERPPRRVRSGSWFVVLTALLIVAVAGVAFQSLYAGPQTAGRASLPGDAGAAVSESAQARELLARMPEAPAPDPGVPAGVDDSIAGATSYGSLLEESPTPLASLFGLEVQTIVLDPGHGGIDPGGSGASGLREKDVTLDVARRLKHRLEANYGFTILMTRDGDVKVPLKERAAFANRNRADLFVSIHVNKLPVEDVTSVETYYFGPHSDERSLRVAQAENAGSDYTMAEFRRIIDRIAGTMRLQESKRLAASTQSSLYRNLRRADPDLRDWGVKTAPFVVLLGVEAPSILTEIGVLSNPADERRLASEAHRERLAAYLERGIINYLKQRPSNELAEHVTAHGSKEE